MILVDTSVWVDHLRNGHSALARLLDAGEAFCHPFIIGELACGGLRRRMEILDLLAHLPSVPVIDHHEVMHLVDVHRLMGSGIGWIDVHLLASTLVSRSHLWTTDRALARVAGRLGIAASPRGAHR